MASGSSLLFAAPLLLSSERFLQFGVIVGAYGAILLLIKVIAHQRARELGDGMVEIDNDIALLGIADDSIERRAQKLFQLHPTLIKR